MVKAMKAAHRSRFVKLRSHSTSNIWLEDIVEVGADHEGCLKLRTEYSPQEDKSVVLSKKEALELADQIADWYGYQPYEPKTPAANLEIGSTGGTRMGSGMAPETGTGPNPSGSPDPPTS